MSFKIILADDHRIMREGLRALLEKQPDIEVLAEYVAKAHRLVPGP